VHDRYLRPVLARDLALLPARRLHFGEEQVLVRVAPEDEQLELLAELLGGEGQVPDFAAVRPPVIWSIRCVALSGCEAS
jgi:hypothetical protein